MALNTGTYNITPGESQKEQDWRRKMAYELWKEGMDAQNIRHPLQGVANLAKAAMGGYELYQADEKDRGRQKAISSMVDGLLGKDDDAAPPIGYPPGSPAPAASPNNKDMAAALRAPTPDGEPPMDRSITVVPASMRNNNPGAMWPGPSATTYGSTGSQNVAGNNKIASFPDAVSGGAAQFDLLNRKYTGMPLADALRKWSGGNNVDSYVGNVSKATGLSPDTMVTAELLRSPQGIGLAQAMARHEAGRNYPMSPDQWTQAQDRVFNPGAGAPRAPLPPGAGPSPVAPVPMSQVDPAQVPIGTTQPPPDIPAMPSAATMPPHAAPAAPVAPPAATAASRVAPSSSSRFTPAELAELRLLGSDPATMPMFLARYQELSKPESWKVVDIDEGPLGKTKMLQSSKDGRLMPISAGLAPGGAAAASRMAPGLPSVPGGSPGAQPAGGFQNVGFQQTQLGGSPQAGGPPEIGYLQGFNWNETDPQKFLEQLDDKNMKGGTATRSAVRAYLNGDVLPTGNPRQYGMNDAAKKIAQRFGEITGTPVTDALYAEKRKFRTELGSNSPSSVGGQSKAFVQGIEHAVDLGETLKKLENSNGLGIPALAAVTNTIRQGVSNDQHALADKAQGIGQTLAGEVGKLFSGSAGGGVHEREMTRARFSTVRSRPQLAAALEATLETMEGGLTALEARRDAVFGPNSKDQNIELVPQQTREKVNALRGIIADLKGGSAPKGAAPEATAAPAPSVPSQAAEFLKKNPSTKDQFIAKYGADAFEQIMAGR